MWIHSFSFLLLCIFFRSEKHNKAKKAYKDKKKRDKASDSDQSDDDSVYSTLEEYFDAVQLTNGILRKANENISALESEIQELERRMKNEEATEEARMEALLRRMPSGRDMHLANQAAATRLSIRC